MKIFLNLVVFISIFQFANVFANINSEKLHNSVLDSFTNHSLCESRVKIENRLINFQFSILRTLKTG